MLLLLLLLFCLLSLSHLFFFLFVLCGVVDFGFIFFHLFTILWIFRWCVLLVLFGECDGDVILFCLFSIFVDLAAGGFVCIF